MAKQTNPSSIAVIGMEWGEFITKLIIQSSPLTVRLDITKILGSIKISASSEDRRNFYKKCLDSIGIEASKDDLTKGS